MAPKIRMTCLKSIGSKYVAIVGKPAPLSRRSSIHQAHRLMARAIKAYDTSLSPSFRSELRCMDMKHRCGSDLDTSSMTVVMSRSPAFFGIRGRWFSIWQAVWLKPREEEISQSPATEQLWNGCGTAHGLTPCSIVRRQFRDAESWTAILLHSWDLSDGNNVRLLLSASLNNGASRQEFQGAQVYDGSIPYGSASVSDCDYDLEERC